MPDAVAGDRLLERPGDVLLADELAERLRPIAAGDDDVLAADCRVARFRLSCAESFMRKWASSLQRAEATRTRARIIRPPVRGPHTKRRKRMAAVFPP